MLALFLAATIHAAQPAPVIQADFGKRMHQWGDDVGDFFGFGDHPEEVYPCSDGQLSVHRGNERESGHELWVLSGGVPAPGLGFGYQAQFAGISEGQAVFVLSFGQRMPPPPVGLNQVQVREKLKLPPRIGFVRIHMQGMTYQPYEVVCDLSKAKPWE